MEVNLDKDLGTAYKELSNMRDGYKPRITPM